MSKKRILGRKIESTVVFALLLISILSLAFDFQPARAYSGPVFIRPDGSVDPVDAPIARNGDLYLLTDNITSDQDGIVIERSNMTLDGEGYTIQGVPVGSYGIRFAGINLTVKNMDIRGFACGVELRGTNCTVANSIFTSNERGIEVNYGSNNTILGNAAFSNYAEGILVAGFNNAILGNKVSGNGDGISLSSGADNTISGNNASSNGRAGIYLFYSEYNRVSDNVVSGNSYAGILLQGNNNSISDNKITLNPTGIRVFDAYDNKIFHNNLVNNTDQVYLANPDNVWDDGYPSGGNYWSDYSGWDSNGDGIGDTPYVIGTSDQDNYPQMNPYIVGDVNYDGIVNALDLSALAKAYGATEDSPSWNVRADTNDDLIIDAIDLFNLARNYG